MSTISLYETILVISTAAVFFVYHMHLYLKIQRDPLTTAIGITNHARHMWVEGIIRDKRDILAVQTLRNQVMAATFLASTAIFISLGSFSAAFRPGVFMEVSHTLNLLGTKTETLWMFKLMLLGILFFVTFFNFSASHCYGFSLAARPYFAIHVNWHGRIDPNVANTIVISTALLQNCGAINRGAETCKAIR